MKTKLLSFISVVVICLGSGSFAQEKICIDGQCQSRPGLANTIVLDPLREQLTLVGRQTKVTSAVASGDRFEKVIQATVRVTVSGVFRRYECGGRDRQDQR
jgi:hypothetical protein